MLIGDRHIEFHTQSKTIAASRMTQKKVSAHRSELVAENISETGFDVVFRTWSDNRVARVRAAWMAIGDLPFEDDWDVE